MEPPLPCDGGIRAKDLREKAGVSTSLRLTVTRRPDPTLVCAFLQVTIDSGASTRASGLRLVPANFAYQQKSRPRRLKIAKPPEEECIPWFLRLTAPVPRELRP